MPHGILSVRQPWAGLIAAGVKRYEVRTWAPAPSSGWLLIHASAGKAVGLRELYEYGAFNKALKRAEMDDAERWTQSAIVGAVHVAAFLDMWKVEQQPKRLTEIDHMMIGEYPSRFLWRFVDARKFRAPIKCHGKLNVWKPGAALSNTIDRTVKREVPNYQPWSYEQPG